MIRVKETKYKECIICGEKSDGTKDVGISRLTGENLYTMSICPGCLQRMAAELTIATLGYDPEKLN